MSVQTAHHAARRSQVDRHGKIPKDFSGSERRAGGAPTGVSTALYGGGRRATFLWFADP
jgi:hypothetical protein